MTVHTQSVQPTHVYLTTDGPMWLKADWRRGFLRPSMAVRKWSPWRWVITAVTILLAPVWLRSATMIDKLSVLSSSHQSERLPAPVSWHGHIHTGPSRHPGPVLIVFLCLFFSSQPWSPPSVPSSVLPSPFPLPLSCGQLRSASVITWNSRCSINWREIWWDKNDGW